mmetsp:Transcript_40131/g.97420  ORF Transcript_40131/g.97420 Transcript_40131/m.97420 type:complete len:114 (-) Transcript_40131:159-500(-)
MEKKLPYSSIYFSSTDFDSEKHISLLNVIELVKDKSKPVLLIEHDGHAHYCAYAPTGFKYEIKPWLRRALQDPKEFHEEEEEAAAHVMQENTSDKPPPRARSTRPIKKPKLSI